MVTGYSELVTVLQKDEGMKQCLTTVSRPAWNKVSLVIVKLLTAIAVMAPSCVHCEQCATLSLPEKCIVSANFHKISQILYFNDLQNLTSW